MRKLLGRSLLFALAIVAASTSTYGQIFVSVPVAPPPLPVYEQPLCPALDYIWVPGYWAWARGDFYWVPGTWVLAPQPGLLWTPGYWAWVNGSYVFYDGYWGPRVGYYGGIVYGYGYFGRGYEGGRWENGHFYYNSSVNNVNVTNIHNVYNTTVVNNSTDVTRVSYNGGRGGVQAQPTAEEEAVAQERHFPPSPAQTQHMQAARSNEQLRASGNHGLPPVAATPKPAAFNESGVVAAKQGAYNPAEAKHAETSRATVELPDSPAARIATHPKELPPVERGPVPNTGSPELDKKYQQQQDQLAAKQEQDRARLQQQQELEHQRLEQQNAEGARRQQMEQEHQHQTQQMTQQHAQQQQAQQAKQQPKQQSAQPKSQQ